MNKNKLILELGLSPNEFSQLCKNTGLDNKNEYSDEETDKLKNHALGYDTSAIALSDHAGSLNSAIKSHLDKMTEKYNSDKELLKQHLLQADKQFNQAYAELLPNVLDELGLENAAAIEKKIMELPKLKLE